ncbi:hypothetical protein BACI71_30790 [Bacillus mycoides]|uniref:Uncharacterized protein n=1 Tax=Bacillus mycoides TaxID=1405 RepID=A0A653YAX2_BACMY|nr:hypothetical protein BACI71_30790 [Bacillus mycoides]
MVFPLRFRFNRFHTRMEKQSCFFHIYRFSFFYPAICRAVKLPPQNSAEAKKLSERLTARKRPIGEG